MTPLQAGSSTLLQWPVPLVAFAASIEQARSDFLERTVFSVKDWLAFYESKQSAYNALILALPEIRQIADFWRHAQEMPAVEWLPAIAGMIQRIRDERACPDCGRRVEWPQRYCPEHKAERRAKTKQRSRQRVALRERMRKCPRCKSEPLQPSARVCPKCRQIAATIRKQNYRKKLKGASCPALTPNFTREEMGTLSAGLVITPPALTVPSSTRDTRDVGPLLPSEPTANPTTSNRDERHSC